MSYETIKPAPGEEPLTWPEKDKLWTEVVMGTAEADSTVPVTEESRRLRNRLRQQWREMQREGNIADHVKD
ncbi:MAG: hypothetical protein HKO63_04650 [Acidimicrobiia bacterium]|nr:hypothetical protein [Acidimicrobiia bacterium]NNL97475.1 hypothetical protein [Acidimicrobiia bacterium]